MNSLLQYLLNVSFSILPFYLLYLACFRRLTFFNWNRWYILSSLVISALIPLISFRAGTTQYLPVQPLPFLPQAAAQKTATPTNLIATTTTIDWGQVVLIIYAAGVLIAAISLVATLIRIVQMIHNSPAIRIHGYRIIKNKDMQMNASFFGYIFLQPSLNTEEAFTIIMHEDAHARRYHTFDILLLELFKIFLWFHPALYHYKKLLQQAHEFEVDQETAQVTDKKTYAHLLLKLQGGHTSPLINSYSSSGITQRIKMLFAERTKRSRKIFYLLIIPCLAVVAIYCSKKTIDVQSDITREMTRQTVRQLVAAEIDNNINKATINTGKEIFLANCAACHKVDADMTGPALAGIENRRTKEWLYKYIRNNNDLLRAGDSTALKLYEDWGKTPMNTFPKLSDKEIDIMLVYIRSVQHAILTKQ